MRLLKHLRILPLLVLVATLSLAVRLGEFATGYSNGGVAFAQQEVDKEPPPLPSAADKDHAEEGHDDGHDDMSGDAAEEGEHGDMAEGEGDDAAHAEEDKDAGYIPPIPMAAEGEKIDWKDSSEAEFEYSDVRQGLYEDLVKRREMLEERERALATREALLEAAERELSQKVREMTAVRDEIEGLLQQQSEQEQERIGSLVRIYEGMKAKDAARIFNTLDMDVLIAVITRMSERKSAPVLAEMNAERARSVTILMAQQKQIPTIPPQ